MAEVKTESVDVPAGRKKTLDWVEPQAPPEARDEKDAAFDEFRKLVQNFRVCAEVKDRTYFLKSYPQTFVGKETVTALVNNGFCATREAAVLLGQKLLQQGVFVNVSKGDFKDDGDYYRFTTSESLLHIATDFWNLRGKFFLKKAGITFAELGTHMSFVRLPSGKFLVLDAIQLSPEQKKEIDALTDDGKLIEAVIALHPFHTLWLPAFHKLYPAPPYYGCPRHLKNLTTIPWAGSLLDEAVRAKWEPHVSMRIPDGIEFVNPTPPASNHTSSVLFLHRESGTLHVDDTFMYITNPNAVLRMAGLVPSQLCFHLGLKKYLVSPKAFHDWMHALLADWEFDNICTAHTGNKIGGAKQMLANLLRDTEPWLKEHAAKKGEVIGASEGQKPAEGAVTETVSSKPEDEINCNAEGDECG